MILNDLTRLHLELERIDVCSAVISSGSVTSIFLQRFYSYRYFLHQQYKDIFKFGYTDVQNTTVKYYHSRSLLAIYFITRYLH